MKRLITTYGLLCIGLTLCWYHRAHADVLQGEFIFRGKTPEVALVYFSEDNSLSAATEVILDQKDKEFIQKLIVGTKGSKVVFQNSDTINHNIFADDKSADVKFDVGLISSGGSTPHEIDWEDKVVRCGCKIHPKMRSWIASISSRYYKIIEFNHDEKSYKFEINDVPTQLTRVAIWMHRYGTLEATLTDGAVTTLPIKRKDEVVGELALHRK